MCATESALELDAFGDAPILPCLTVREELQLRQGDRVEHVVMSGSSTGSGISVQDVRASPDKVFSSVAAFEMYDRLIKTVRAISIYEQQERQTKALIEVSRFKLKLYVNFTSHEATRYIAWTLDRDNVTPFIRECVGYWYVEDLTDTRPGWSRVWFVVRVRLRPFVPKIIERLVAKVGLRRATNWLQDLSEARADSAADPPDPDDASLDSLSRTPPPTAEAR
jgi:ribosome-associated toxin RatA of RatAB toxin-antitoxin module